jgi:hypothetical protein
LYRYPALIPENNRIVPVIPEPPKEAVMTTENGVLHLSWVKGNETRIFVLYKFRKGKTADMNNPENIILVTTGNKAEVNPGWRGNPSRYSYYITSVSKTNTESSPVRFDMFKDIK